MICSANFRGFVKKKKESVVKLFNEIKKNHKKIKCFDQDNPNFCSIQVHHLIQPFIYSFTSFILTNISTN